MEERKLRAYVGKVNMDIQSPEYLCETAEESLYETEAFLEQYAGNRYAKPTITPRFAPTCSFELLKGLGTLGKKYGAGMQTHLVESRWEAQEAVRLNPDCRCDTEIYEKAGLLENGPVIAAHFIFPGEEDIRLLRKYGGYAVQCPDATVNIIAGIMRTAYLADEGIHLGIGSDIAGGHLPGIYTQAARSVQLSKMKAFYEPEGNRAIPFANAFYMATKEGGALFGKVGSLEPGYEFDALVIRDFSDPFRKTTPEETAERFCYTGHAEDIIAGFVHGEQVTGAQAEYV
jgi:guanine deaminase